MSGTILEIKDLKILWRHSYPPRPFAQGSKGEVVVVLGPSGCGKSTLLRCINGLETIQAGDILLDGQSITKNQKTSIWSAKRLGWSSKVMNSSPFRRPPKLDSWSHKSSRTS